MSRYCSTVRPRRLPQSVTGVALPLDLEVPEQPQRPGRRPGLRWTALRCDRPAPVREPAAATGWPARARWIRRVRHRSRRGMGLRAGAAPQRASGSATVSCSSTPPGRGSAGRRPARPPPPRRARKPGARARCRRGTAGERLRPAMPRREGRRRGRRSASARAAPRRSPTRRWRRASPKGSTAGPRRVGLRARRRWRRRRFVTPHAPCAPLIRLDGRAPRGHPPSLDVRTPRGRAGRA